MPANRLHRQLVLGNRYLEEQQFEEAVLAFDRAIGIDEACVEAYLGKVEAYEGLNDYEKAVEFLEICYNLSGDSHYTERIQDIRKRYDVGISGERGKGEKIKQESEEKRAEEPIPEWSEDAAHRAYEVIIQEYTEITGISPEEWRHDSEQYFARFPDLKQAVMDDYFTPSHYDEMIGGDEPCELAYSYFDIDHNGISELILWHLHHEATIFEIYVYDGIRLRGSSGRYLLSVYCLY